MRATFELIPPLTDEVEHVAHVLVPEHKWLDPLLVELVVGVFDQGFYLIVRLLQELAGVLPESFQDI
jgi:hypothetical protein